VRAPLSWLREYADLPADVTGRDLATRLVAAGLEVETVDRPGHDIEGPVVLGRVQSFQDETASNGKTVRWCTVDVGEAEPRGIVCGALNFAVGDHVVVALPGATLPGGFAIAARKTYGHLSDGMICSARELGTGDDNEGILVLPADLVGDAKLGADAVDLLDLRDEVLDIAITPDRSYALSMRGLAREAATAYDVAFHDPAAIESLPIDGTGHPGVVVDPTAADRLVLRTVTGLDPAAGTPLWMARRLVLSGMRPVSLAVDVTNYVMLELGQPLHAFDRTRLKGPVTVRRAEPGEVLETLDHVTRTLDPGDVVIADDSGAVGLAGTMGGLTTEIDAASTELVIEAAHFAPVAVARMARRHKVSSEAAKRFERGVDPELPPVASTRAVQLLGDLGGALHVGSTEVDHPRAVRHIELDPARPGRTAGLPIAVREVERRLTQVGCTVDTAAAVWTVTPPTWRPRPRVPGRPRRGGHPAGRLRDGALCPAAGPARPRLGREPAAAPPDRPRPRARRLRRDTVLSVHRRGRPGRARPGTGRRPAQRGPAGQPAQRQRATAAHHPPARAARGPAPQRGPGDHGRRAVRGRAGGPSRTGHPADRAPAVGGTAADRGGDRRAGCRAAGPAAAGRCRAGGGAGAGRLVGPRSGCHLVGRRRGRPPGRARGPGDGRGGQGRARPVAPGPVCRPASRRHRRWPRR
jgi:phenylalanyl-tRNA synthetase beta chain